MPLFSFHLLILILGVLYLSFGPIFARWGVYPGLFLNELAFIFIPGLVLRRLYRERPGQTFVLFKDLVWTLVAILAAFPIILIINSAFLGFISGHVDLTHDTLVWLRGEDRSYLGQIFFLAWVPALMEETFFRGSVQDIYSQRFGIWSVPLSALVFAIFHFDLQSLVSPFLIGVILGLIYYTTRSLFLVIIGHLFHNFLSISLIFFYKPGFFEGLAQALSGIGAWISGLLAGALLLLCIYLFLKSLIFLSKGHRISQPRVGWKAKEFAPLGLLIIVYLVFCLY